MARSARSGSEDWRQLVHAASGAGAVFLRYWPPWLVALTVFGGAVFAGLVSMHVHGKRGSSPAAEEPRLPGPLYREGESPWRSGAITYSVGVILAVLLFPPEAAFVGWLILAAGDSAATVFGERWPLRMLTTRRSVGGSLSFCAFGILAVSGGLVWWHGFLRGEDVISALTAVLGCAVAEAVLGRVDDNLYLPALGAGLFDAGRKLMLVDGGSVMHGAVQ